MATKANELDITVLIPTYNRAEILRETLEAMCQVERDGLAVEFVVIDNNSADHTKEVVESFAGRLPMQYLFESRPGKNCALNKALDEVTLGEIVVLTDDDVTPSGNWLEEINGVCKRWPRHSVFGGAIKAAWPNGEAPAWASLLGYGDHRPFDTECLYPQGLGGSGRPAGAHYWIRRKVFENDWRYDETVGPHPTKERRGSEESMLNALKKGGYEIVYCPNALLEHRVQPELLVPRRVRKKAWADGVAHSRARVSDVSHTQEHRPLVWNLRRVAALFYGLMRLVLSQLHVSHDKRFGCSLEPISDIAYNMEAIKYCLQWVRGMAR